MEVPCVCSTVVSGPMGGGMKQISRRSVIYIFLYIMFTLMTFTFCVTFFQYPQSGHTDTQKGTPLTLNKSQQYLLLKQLRPNKEGPDIACAI